MSAACDLCGGSEFGAYAPGMYTLSGCEYDLVRCRACSLVQVRPLPDSASIASLYGDEYFEQDYDSCLSEDTYFDSFPRLMARYGALLDAIESHHVRGDLFEVGCAGGYFLQLAQERGWKTRGIEITDAGTRHARDVLGLDVTRGGFPEPGFASDPVDVVYMGHVLEHVPSPTAALEAARALLRPEGLLVVEVPSYIDSGYFRALKRILPALRALGLDAPELLRALKFPRPGETMKPFHLYEFRRRTLVRLLEQLGFRVLRTESRVPKPDRLAHTGSGFDRAVGLAFDALDLGARRLGLAGGNITAFARRSG